jgi:broad specificity phosphatase PhoE
MPPPIVFIRHGETDWNAEGRLQGQRDIPLNAVGREQAVEVGWRLRKHVEDLEALPWLVSPLSRTRETAEIARRAVGFDPFRYELDDRLRELTFGDWEGCTWKELRAVDPDAVTARAADKWGYVPPDGESYGMLCERMSLWLQTFAKPAIVVSHGGVARVLLVLLAGWDPEGAVGADIWQGKLLMFSDGEAAWL